MYLTKLIIKRNYLQLSTSKTSDHTHNPHNKQKTDSNRFVILGLVKSIYYANEALKNATIFDSCKSLKDG